MLHDGNHACRAHPFTVSALHEDTAGELLCRRRQQINDDSEWFRITVNLLFSLKFIYLTSIANLESAINLTRIWTHTGTGRCKLHAERSQLTGQFNQIASFLWSNVLNTEQLCSSQIYYFIIKVINFWLLREARCAGSNLGKNVNSDQWFQ